MPIAGALHCRELWTHSLLAAALTCPLVPTCTLRRRAHDGRYHHHLHLRRVFGVLNERGSSLSKGSLGTSGVRGALADQPHNRRPASFCVHSFLCPFLFESKPCALVRAILGVLTESMRLLLWSTESMSLLLWSFSWKFRGFFMSKPVT